MNSESARLQSFNLWSVPSNVCFRNLAKNGFYATGNLLEVECNWCHCRINEWNCSEEIEQRHIQLNPQCQFIVNRHNCGNLPLTSNESQQEQRNIDEVNGGPPSAMEGHSKLDLLIEKDRLATFVNWPNPNITPQSLAKAGFFYRNRSDEVECAWCKGVIAQWEKQDNAFEEHRRFFPDCPRVQLGPLIEMANDGIRDLGIQQISSPKNPKYTSLHARLRTYSNWPIPDIQRPEDLAQAGLYYQKVDDQVRCFHCNMGLRSWEKEDDPWFEHAKWYPMCDFVRLVKGSNYIHEVQELTRSAQTSESPTVPMTMEDAMQTEPVKLALEMGVNIDVIRNKTQQQILKTGYPYKTIEELLKYVFDEQENTDLDLQNIPQSSNSSNNQSMYQNRQCETENSSGATCNDTIRNNVHSNSVNVCSSTSSSSPSAQEPNGKNAPEINNDLAFVEPSDKLTSDRKLLEEENRKLKDARLCKVCLDEEVGVVYLPCGHLVTCVQCAPGVSQCPMCRTAIKGFVRTYLS